tara:strand:+ start:3778 stop:4005 length:228 start_codon:yes stop_codon:yes gene_type:complete
MALISIDTPNRAIVAGMVGGACAIAAYVATKSDNVFRKDTSKIMRNFSRAIIVVGGWGIGLYGTEAMYMILDKEV